VTKVVAPGPELKVVAENRLDEVLHASPAVAGGRIYLRGDRHYYAIGKR
jgi:hypothetical protein